MSYYMIRYKELHAGFFIHGLPDIDQEDRRCAVGDLIPDAPLHACFSAWQHTAPGSTHNVVIVKDGVVFGYIPLDMLARDWVDKGPNKTREDYYKDLVPADRQCYALTKMLAKEYGA